MRSAKKPSVGASLKFVEPMLLLKTNKLPEGNDWLYELKLDGYRALGFKSAGNVNLRSRNDKDFVLRFNTIAEGLQHLPDETIVDGEIVALDEAGKPSFNLLQNHGSSRAPIIYYVFDVLMLRGKGMMHEPLSKRREVLEKSVLSKLSEPIRFSPVLARVYLTSSRRLRRRVWRGWSQRDVTALISPESVLGLGKRCVSIRARNW